MTASRYGFFGLMDEAETIMTIHSWSGQAMVDCAMVVKPVAVQNSRCWFMG
jgi:hypothetical protein